jgi:hypothetical protein
MWVSGTGIFRKFIHGRIAGSRKHPMFFLLLLPQADKSAFRVLQH